MAELMMPSVGPVSMILRVPVYMILHWHMQMKSYVVLVQCEAMC